MALSTWPYLQFPDNNCREAFETYGRIFGAEPQLMLMRDMGYEGPLADNVMHGAVHADGLTIMGSDNVGEVADMSTGNAFSVSIMGGPEDLERATALFDALADRGMVGMPMELQGWGSVYGELVDRFGVRWLFNIEQA